MYSQQQPSAQAGTIAGANNFNAFASGTRSAPSTLLPVVPSAPLEGLFGDFPADTQAVLPEHMMSESSADDDMAMPESDSVDQTQHTASTRSTDGSTSSASDAPQPPHRHHNEPSSASGMTSTHAFPSHSLPSLLPPHMTPTATTYLENRSPYDLPAPSVRVKRSSPDMPDATVERSMPPSHLQPSMLSGMPSAASQIGISIGNVTPNRRRTSMTTRAIEVPQPSLMTGNGTEGYYYRSRDKTNYNQAHKGTLPSPPSTPDSQKRIRCTWNLEETRVLYDLLKDVVGADNFPDVQQIRAHLIRIDPQCSKTLDHVRNKKANLIQKAHSKNVSVGEILIADMHKLEMEAAGATGARGAAAQSPTNQPAASGTASVASPVESMSPASSRSTSVSSQIREAPPVAAHPHPHPPHPHPARGSVSKVGNVRPGARRRLSKRSSNPSVLSSSMQPSQTATAQQLAKVAASGSVPHLSTGPTPSGLSAGSPVVSTSMANVGSSNGMNPSIAPDSSYDTNMFAKAYYMAPQLSEAQKWQRWYYDSLSRLYVSENEVRTRLGLPTIEMTPPPLPVINALPQKLPPSSQWITSWNVSDSLDSETESSDEHSNGTLIDPTRSTGSTSW